MRRWMTLALLVVSVASLGCGESVPPNEVRISPLIFVSLGYARRLTNIGDLSLWLSYDKGRGLIGTDFIPFIGNGEWLTLSIRIGRPKGFAFEIGRGWAKIEGEEGLGGQASLSYRFSPKFQLGLKASGCSSRNFVGVTYSFVFSFNF